MSWDHRFAGQLVRGDAENTTNSVAKSIAINLRAGVLSPAACARLGDA
eukprot:CAMPEP_0174230052 /NCGR_PEP_ID=MMETSP0417-20130205/890_1 /TAXON_ID=242541 /ORGANISM="Mayorella sp, Strain BSH-02190019" /LENGTH=47 /DNA_ID= /DNA_START= /DNA_END= /DNA_ORIENTATION=